MTSLSHMGFVWLSYGLSAVVITVLFGWIVATGRRREAQLEALTTDQDRSSNDR